LPEEIREGLDFVLVDSVGEVLDVALDGTGDGRRPAPLHERAAARSRT
jgi:hypothetical protein